eukprot:364114-Chlamydomonas_euryale.AAC.2
MDAWPRLKCTSRPSGDLAATAARSMSPVARWQRQCSNLMRGDCVPLPHPGGPATEDVRIQSGPFCCVLRHA